MLGRIKRQQKKREQAPEADTGSIHGVGSLIGGSGVSLDGQSLMLPDEHTMQFGDGDEVSSIATSNYGAYSSQRKSSFRIVGPAEEPAVPPVPTDAETGVPANGDHNDGDEEEDEHPGTSEKVAAGGGGCCGGSCMPRWLSDSPFWVKGVIILGLALLVGAAVLVAVAAGMDSGGNSGGSGSSGSVVGGSQGDTSSPTVAPRPPPPPTAEPTLSPKPSVMPFPGQTPEPTDVPSASPSAGETAAPTIAETGVPSSLPSATLTETPTEDPGPSTNIVTFYATAGRFQGSDLAELEDGLPNLPTDGGDAFMVHLGDWNSPFATGCSPQSYTDNAELYNTSSVPVLFIPGDNGKNEGLWL